MKVIGIDPGFSAVGLAKVRLHSDHETVETLAVIRTKKSDRKRNVFAADDNARRLVEIVDVIRRQLTGTVVAIAMEAASSPRNSSVAAKVALVHGAVLALAADRGIPVVQVPPMDIKKAVTGLATTSKADVRISLERRYGELPWPSPPSMVEHAADALGAIVAAMSSPVVILAQRMQAANPHGAIPWPNR